MDTSLEWSFYLLLILISLSFLSEEMLGLKVGSYSLAVCVIYWNSRYNTGIDIK